MAPRTSVPILLLTGFLGSGKTSLLKRWLSEPEFSGAMVIVNELGEVGLDDRLIGTASEAPLLLDNGCACCAAGDDLAATLERLFLDRLHRVIPPFTWVLIETTGVARPQPILDLLAGHALVAERYHLAGVVTSFDARRGPMLLASQPECREQIAAACAVVITKTDLVDAADLAFARDTIARERPDVAVLRSGLDTAWASAAPVLTALGAARQAPAAHVHAADHLADVTTAFVPLAPVPREALETAIALVFGEFGPDLLRLKGAVEILGETRPQVVQAEAGLPLHLTPLPMRPGERPMSGVTLIARGHQARDMAAALQSCIASALHSASEGPCRHV